MTKKILMFLVAFVTFGCAHHRDVRPGADGIHRVVVRDSESESAERSAISQAEHFCQQYEKQYGIVNEKETQYTGEMDESTRKTLKKASTAATVLGGGASVLGRNGVRTGGNVVGAAGTVGMIMTSGDDYIAEIRFRCL